MRDVPQTPEEIAALRAKVDGDPQLRGMLVTPDQRAAVVVVDFWEGTPATSWRSACCSWPTASATAPVDFYFAGEPMIALTDVEQSREMALRIPLIFLVIALMLLVSFRNLQGMLIPMLTAALSTVWGLGLMGHTGIVIDTWNVATPILLIAIAAAHSAQMLKRYIEEVERLGDNRAAVVASTAAMGPVMIAAGGVAALGFASLALFGVPAIANFGLSCAYGIGSAVLLEMTFIPALRSLLPAPKARLPKGGVDAAASRLARARHPRPPRPAGADRHRRRPAARRRRRAADPHLRLDARVHGARQPAARPPRGDREALPRHGHDDHALRRAAARARRRSTCCATWTGLQAELERDPLVWRTASLADLVKTLHKTFNADAPDPYRLPDNQELTVAAHLPRQLAGLRALHRPRATRSRCWSPTCATTTRRASARCVARARAWVAAQSAARRASTC